MFIALSLVGFGMMALTLFQVRFGLLPLRKIEQRTVRYSHRASQPSLDAKLPSRSSHCRYEINALIQSNQDVIDRARTQVGNLAHALKTPLAVIINEADEDKSPFASQSRRASAAHARSGQLLS